MANELNITLGQTGLTVIARLFSAGSQVGTDISLTEIVGQGGYYTGNMPAVAAAYYDVLFLINGVIRGSNSINWSGTTEIVGSSLTALAIRTEMDTNSTKLSNLDATVSSRLSSSAYTVPPTVVQIRAEMDTNSTKLSNLDATISSRLSSSAYAAPPTVIQIRAEMDANSVKLAGAATSAAVSAVGTTILQAVGTPFQAGSYVVPPSASSIADTIATVLFVDGGTNQLKVHPDHSVDTSNTTVANYVTVPAAIAVASQEPSVIVCIRGDTLRVALPLMGSLTGRSKLVLTVKVSTSDTDLQAVLQVVEGIGLTRVNGSGSVNPASASLDVIDATTGAVTLVVNADITAALAIRDLEWDTQVNFPTGIVSPLRGSMTIVADVTQSVT